MAGTPPPAGLPTLESMRDELAGWPLVQEDPEPFLALGLCSLEWLRRALPALLEAELEAPLEGDQLVHLDIRSDNVCIRDGRAILVDWNWACVGNAAIDFATSLPSIHMEGGPDPRELAPPGSEPFAALAAGYLCAPRGPAADLTAAPACARSSSRRRRCAAVGGRGARPAAAGLSPRR